VYKRQGHEAYGYRDVHGGDRTPAGARTNP
jgi:hypothetical protein